MEGVVREDRKMGVLAWFILALMFSPPLQAEEMQSDDNVFVIPILEGCKEHALDAVRELAEHGKIKYKFKDGIFLSYFLPKFIGYLEIEELDNEIRGISKHLGFKIYDGCMPTVPTKMEYSEANIIYLSHLLLEPSYKDKYKEKYIKINEEEIVLYPIVKEQVRNDTPNTAPQPTQ
jgi:hypothetical protein